MDYEKELQFFREFMDKIHLNTWTFTPDQEIPAFDLGLREFLYSNYDYNRLVRTRIESLKPNTLYWITDEFSSRYVYFLLPPPHEGDFFILGPYLTLPVRREDALCIANRHSMPSSLFSQFFQYYEGLALFSNENILLAALNTLGQHMWGDLNLFTLEYIERSLPASYEPVTQFADTPPKADSILSMQNLERRYEQENKMIQAVSQGFLHKAEMFLFEGDWAMEQRTLDPLRNLKNYMIITNTLLRKGAEAGAVHPLHIDTLSSQFAHKIEQLVSPEYVPSLYREMIRKYCMLVKNHSLKGYSLLIRKVLTRIDYDLTADHSLKAQAELLNINASYLSNLFKKEVGITLTDYTNRRRVRYAVFLLNTTTMQIQVIAQYCGIPDVNYFTKTFKKYIGKTPKEYRDGLLTM